MSVLPTELAAPNSPAMRSNRRGGIPVVLVIEDDDLVAAVLERLLERRGWRVVRAATGAAGAQRFAEYEREIALVVVDCCLPDIDGVRLGRALRHIVPDLPLLLTSGWENQAATALAEKGPTRFIAKPFTPGELFAEVDAIARTSA